MVAELLLIYFVTEANFLFCSLVHLYYRLTWQQLMVPTPLASHKKKPEINKVLSDSTTAVLKCLGVFVVYWGMRWWGSGPGTQIRQT